VEKGSECDLTASSSSLGVLILALLMSRQQ